MPGLAWIWYGQPVGVIIHQLNHTTITCYDRSIDIPLVTLHTTNHQPPVPIRLPSLPQNVWMPRHDPNNRPCFQDRVPLGLELHSSPYSFGHNSLFSAEIQFDDQLSVLSAALPSSPTISNPYLMYGASEMNS